MNTYLYIALYSGLDLISYLLSYGTVIGSLNRKAVKLFIPLFFATVAVLPVLHSFVPDGWVIDVSLLVVILVYFILCSYRGWKLAWLYFVSILISSIAQVLVEYAGISIWTNDPRESGVSPEVLIIKAVALLLLFFLYLWRYSLQSQKTTDAIDKTQIITFITGLLCCVAIISANLLLVRGFEFSIGKRFALGLFNVLACFAFIALSLRQSRLLKEKLEMEADQKVLNSLLKIQEEHLKDIVMRDEEMRRFRHDLRAHMSVISSYSKRGDIDSLRDYMKKIDEHVSLSKSAIECGSESINAVIRDMKQQMETKGIALNVNGGTFIREEIDDFDLCIVIYNLLCNAMDECERRNCSDDAVFISMQTINDKIWIEVRNPCDMPDSDELLQLNSSKADSFNHGLGSGNIERIVNKYNGHFTRRVKAGKFIAEVLL